MIDKNTNPSLYIFQWISDLGGADTRLKELLILLHKDFSITCIPNDDFRLNEKQNTDFLDNLGIQYCAASKLPKKLEGFAYSNCNFRIFSEKEKIKQIKDSGLKFLWSNDMMWVSTEELEEIAKGNVDCMLFTSPFHRDVLSPAVLQANPKQTTAILENYFDSTIWPYIERPQKALVSCGKVSRDDFDKFSENFPIFYESATENLPVNYKIMGWNDALKEKYSWFDFSNKWELLPANAKKTQLWFNDLDIFLYDCNFKFVENQSRTVIESQLTGCPVVAPNKWNFPNMLWDQRTGFLWDNLDQLKDSIEQLMDYEIRSKMGKLASEATRAVWSDAVAAKRKWQRLLDGLAH